MHGVFCCLGLWPRPDIWDARELNKSRPAVERVAPFPLDRDSWNVAVMVLEVCGVNWARRVFGGGHIGSRVMVSINYILDN